MNIFKKLLKVVFYFIFVGLTICTTAYTTMYGINNFLLIPFHLAPIGIVLSYGIASIIIWMQVQVGIVNMIADTKKNVTALCKAAEIEIEEHGYYFNLIKPLFDRSILNLLFLGLFHIVVYFMGH